MCFALTFSNQAHAGTYRDELTFLGRTTFLLRNYALVVPLDIKRQPLPGEVFVEIKAWGAWNGSWVPYIYEPIDVPGSMPEDFNSIFARYRQMKPEAPLNARKGPDNSFLLTYEKGRTRFDLRTRGFAPRVLVQNPEGRLALGVAEGDLTVNGHVVAGRVAIVTILPESQSDASLGYGLYDHFTVQLPSGDILVVYHSRSHPGFNLGALLTPDGKGDRQTRTVRVAWRKPWSDAESGRTIPTAWVVEAPEIGIKAEIDEWGRNVVHYKTDAGKTAVFVNAMVRGSVSVDGVALAVFGLNAHIQDE